MKQGWIQVTSNNTQEPLAPKTMADMVYMDDPQSESVKDAIQNHTDAIQNHTDAILYHTPIHLLADLPASGWSAAAPYTQTVQVAGLLATDIPLVDVTLSATLVTRIAQREAYGYVSMITTAANSITVTCDEDKPTVDLSLTLKVVR